MNNLCSKLDTAELEGEFEEITQNTADNKRWKYERGQEKWRIKWKSWMCIWKEFQKKIKKLRRDNSERENGWNFSRIDERHESSDSEVQ